MTGPSTIFLDFSTSADASSPPRHCIQSCWIEAIYARRIEASVTRYELMAMAAPDLEVLANQRPYSVRQRTSPIIISVRWTSKSASFTSLSLQGAPI
jgi:hypothetical protein